METIHKNDFIEIEFTGLANGEIFDTTNKEEAKQIGLDADVKPMIICVGNQMLLKGLDEDLGGKEIGKKARNYILAHYDKKTIIELELRMHQKFITQ